ncbi:hypothetical protein HBI09_072710 [Parastagonospora nodorum]|nr:hypothetical protein HBI09_072710 [Parastagonospora nodorum]KAH5015774.1 hypothetical protein HBI77_065160 [Parastagonospora nodorum]KAH5310573.1 hypothetical protein HBI12_146420 [Parastagonospora nodorum]
MKNQAIFVYAHWHSIVICLLVVTVARLLWVRVRHLRSVPGPLFAKFTPLYRIWTAATGKQFVIHQKLHDAYGPVVRIGPNHVSVSDAASITDIYGIASKFYKSDCYTLFDVPTKSGLTPTVFSVRDNTYHRQLKRPVANAYSMTSLVELEPMTDVCIKILEKKFERFQGQGIDLGEWLHWYAFDVITSITFSNCMGFMESEQDISGIIRAIEGRLFYNSIVGQVPALHKFLLGNRFVSRIANLLPSVRRLNTTHFIVDFARTQLSRYQTVGSSSDDLKDMLARFKRSNKDGGQAMTSDELLSHATGNILAGSDTTAISLRATFYHLLKIPRTYIKLLAEIDAAHTRGDLSDPITFAEANQLSYLQLCIKEAMRMHPSCGQLLERVVPAGGMSIASVFLPEGTVVGINPWVVAQDKDVYGDDVGVFRPERWSEASPAQLRLMERNFLAFGSGGRTCLGKSISMLEMTKLVPQILRRFRVELVAPEKKWELEGFWFVKQSGLLCRITERGISS